MKGFNTKYIVRILDGIKIKEYEFSKEKDFLEFITIWNERVLVIYEVKTIEDYINEEEY